MSARLARAEVLAALRDAPASGATVGDLCGAVGLSPTTIARAVARLVAEGEVEVVGVPARDWTAAMEGRARSLLVDLHAAVAAPLVAHG